jgi:hypothetical protein
MVQLSLCFNWAPRHDSVLGEWRYSSTHSLSSALDEGEWSVSRPGRFNCMGRAPGTHWIGGWVGPRAVLDAVVKRKTPSPSRESNPRTPIVQPLAERYTDWVVPNTKLFLSLNKGSWNEWMWHHTAFLLLTAVTQLHGDESCTCHIVRLIHYTLSLSLLVGHIALCIIPFAVS